LSLVFAQAREAARKTTCLSNHKQLGNSLLMYLDLGTWTLPWSSWTGGGRGAFIAHNGKGSFTFFDGHVKSINPCATFGSLAWKQGEAPPDDYLWEWWSGPDPVVLAGWQRDCYKLPEYR
jgi:prepilin-type processing-associated H-X9-DG protein